jgi:hypothetical protein
MIYKFQKVSQANKSDFLQGNLLNLNNIAHIVSCVVNEDGSFIEKKEAMIYVLYDLVSQGKAYRRNDFFSNCIKFFDLDFKCITEDEVYICQN